jgi:hypothetical protein
MSNPTQTLTLKENPGEPHWLELVRQHVGSLRYGIVQIVIHDSKVIQIEKTERVRLDKPHADQSEADQNTGGSQHHTTWIRRMVGPEKCILSSKNGPIAC